MSGLDTTVTLDFALMRRAGMMDQLLVCPERILASLESLGGVVYAGEVLLALTPTRILREGGYRIVPSCAMATWTKLGTPEGGHSVKTWRRPRRWRRGCLGRRHPRDAGGCKLW